MHGFLNLLLFIQPTNAALLCRAASYLFPEFLFLCIFSLALFRLDILSGI